MLKQWIDQWFVGLCIGLAAVLLVAGASLLAGQPVEILHLRDGATRWTDWAALGVFATLWASVRSYVFKVAA